MMRNYLKSSVAAFMGVGLLAFTSVASAQELSLKVEGGAAVPLTSPQVDRFNVGGGGTVKAGIGVTPYLDVTPSVSVLALPSTVAGVDAGTAWGFGAGLRLKRPHDESNAGTGLSAISPWVDADLQATVTGDLLRAGVSVGAGASVPLNDNRSLWFGPFVRYHDIVQERNPGFDDRDAHILVVGVGLEFDCLCKAPPRVKVINVTELLANSDTDYDGVSNLDDQCPDVPGPKENNGCPYPPPPNPVVVPPSAEFRQRIQFPWDSAVIQASEFDKLNEVVKSLLADAEYKSQRHLSVVVEGHASSEGQAEHNQKLSEKRAQSVVDFLVAHGVDRSRLTAKGFGTSVPVADNSTEAGRVLNRRVEFDVTFVLTKGK